MSIMKKAVKILFWIVIFTGMVSIGLTFYETVILRDYQIVEVEE